MRLEESEYITTQASDILGFSNEEDGCSVAYNFNFALPVFQWPSIIPIAVDPMPVVGQIHSYYTTELPYDFSLGAAFARRKVLAWISNLSYIISMG